MKEPGLRAQCGSLYYTSQNSTTWRSDRKLVRKEAGLRALFYQATQCHVMVRSKVCEEEAGLRDLC